MQYTLMSHGKVLGRTGAAFPPDELPAGASVWHLVPAAAFDFVEPIIAELTAPPALALVEEVIPTQEAYLHPAWSEREAQMERLIAEAARIHHFRLVLERYEALDLELRDASGRRLADDDTHRHEADGEPPRHCARTWRRSIPAKRTGWTRPSRATCSWRGSRARRRRRPPDLAAPRAARQRGRGVAEEIEQVPRREPDPAIGIAPDAPHDRRRAEDQAPGGVRPGLRRVHLVDDPLVALGIHHDS